MKILMGYSSSKIGDKALNIAIQHAKIFGAQVLVLTSLTGGTVTEKIEIQYAEEDLEKVKQLFEKEGIPCETHLLVRGFKAGEDIVLFAKEHQVDEIIIGVKRRSKVGKLLFGSNAQYVILRAHCPVLSVNEDE